VLPLAPPELVNKQVHQLCDLFGTNGGFVFNSIHNIQANVPVENAIALMDAISSIRK
jgi:uroporphyrinogen-III decarboxylase